MKKLLVAIVCIVALFLVNSLQGQNVKAFGPLFKAAKKQEKIQFLADLRRLINGVKFGNQIQRDIFEDLKNGLPTTNPTAGIDSILQVWTAGRANLQGFLNGNPAEFDSLEVKAILGGFDVANAAWIQNLTEIRTGFDKYRDTLQVDKTTLAEAEANYKASTAAMNTAIDKSYQNFTSDLLKISNLSNERDWEKIVQSLFKDFGALEIGAGFQSVLAIYYEEKPDSATAMLVRFGSAPNYNSLWGAEWDVWASFKTERTSSENNDNQQNGFQPLLAGGNVSFQYRPEIPFTKGVMRLIAGVGASIEAYMPARINQNKPASLNNKGKTTGFGPSVKLGFAVSTSTINFYAYGHTSKGYVLRCPDYPFSSWQVVSGVQWQALHLRMLHGASSWAKFDQRTAAYNEISVSVRIN